MMTDDEITQLRERVCSQVNAGRIVGMAEVGDMLEAIRQLQRERDEARAQAERLLEAIETTKAQMQPGIPLGAALAMVEATLTDALATQEDRAND